MFTGQVRVNLLIKDMEGGIYDMIKKAQGELALVPTVYRQILFITPIN